MGRLLTGFFASILLTTLTAAQPLIFHHAEISDLQFGDPDVWSFAKDSTAAMYAATDNLGALQSTDGGEHWQRLGLSQEDFLAVAVDADDRVVAGSFNGRGVLRTEDKGQTWEQIGLDSLDISAIVIAPTGEIYAAAGTNRPNIVHRSDTSGTLWTQASAGMDVFLIWALQVRGNGDVVAATSEGVYVTTDKGVSWTPTLLVYAICFAERDDGTLYVGGEGVVYRSTDGGFTWESIWLSGEDRSVLSMAVRPDGRIFAGIQRFGSSRGGVYHSADSGSTWQLAGLWGTEARALALTSQGRLVVGATDSPVNGIFLEVTGGDEALFMGQWNVSAVADEGGAVDLPEVASIIAYFEENGTMTWFVNAVDPGMDEQYSGKYAANESALALALGFEFTELEPSSAQASFDFATDFDVVLSFSGASSEMIGHIFGLQFVGDVQLTLSKSLVAVEDVSIPSAFWLHPNYPNPFNPSTTIRYDVPEQALVKIAVYDALGRLVEILSTKYQVPGTYAATWDAAGRPTGVYFVRMEAGAFVASRRMILIR